MKKTLICAVVAAMLSLTACQTTTTGSAARDKTVASHKAGSGGSQSTKSSQPAAPPSPKPNVKYGQDCDYLLGDFSSNTSSGFRFVADANLTNTGNIGVVVSVKASWSQAGGAPITMTKKIKVPTGAKRRVSFTKPVGQDEIDKIQSVSYDHECKVVASMVDTFGNPS